MRNIKRFFAFSLKSMMILCLVSFLNHVMAQETMTLEHAIALGLSQNLGLQIQEKDIEIAHNNNTWGNAGRAPLISLGAQLRPLLTSDNNPASFLNGEYVNGALSGNVDLAYDIYNGGRIKINKEIFESQLVQSSLAKEQTINALIAQISRAYYQIIRERQRLVVFEEVFELSKEKRSYEQVKFQYGKSNRYTIDQFNLSAKTDSINIIQTENALNTSMQELYTILQVDVDAQYAFDADLDIALEDLDFDKLEERLEESNYTLRTLGVVADLQVLNQRIAQSLKRPTVSLTASFAASENYFKIFAKDQDTGESRPGIFSNRFQLGAGIQVNWLALDGNQRNIDIKNSKLQEEQSRLDVLDAKADLINELRTLELNYNAQKEIVQALGNQLELYDDFLNLSNERYKLAQITSLDYRNIQLQYTNAEFDYINAVYNILLTKTFIDELIGFYN